MKYILGIDPGLGGAIAYFKFEKDMWRLVGMRDMPVMENPYGKGRVVDCYALCDLMSPFRGHECLAIIERVQSMPNDGAAGAFKFGQTAMAPEALCAAYQIPIFKVSPGVWKRAAKLIKRPKGASIAKAKTLWPDMAGHFRLKKHEGRAEAALIGHHGYVLYQKDHGKD